MTLRPQSFRAISELLYAWAGIRIYGKEQMVESRLGPRVRRLGLRYTEYIEHIRAEGPGSADATDFINALTTNKTAFFREPHHFRYLRDQLFPRLRAASARGAPRIVRLWSAGCSTGEEAYSIALVCRHGLPGWDIRILATDIDTDVLAVARAGIYSRDATSPIPPHFTASSFEDAPGGGRRIRPEIAELVQFTRENLTSPQLAVRGTFHVIFCRNVMIYFDRATQQRLIAGLGERLTPGGVLVVGHAESLVANEMVRVSDAMGVYTRTSPAATVEPRHAPFVEEPGSRSLRYGDVETSITPCRLTTLLGTGVAVCLHDPSTNAGGMTHILSPGPEVERLIASMVRLGASRERMVAKIFGAALLQPLAPGAETNVQHVRAHLERAGLPIVVERLGGLDAREIELSTHTGEVRLRIRDVPRHLLEAEVGHAGKPQEPAESPPYGGVPLSHRLPRRRRRA